MSNRIGGLTLCANVGLAGGSAGERKGSFCDWVKVEMRHECRQIKVTEQVTVVSVYGLCNPRWLLGVFP